MPLEIDRGGPWLRRVLVGATPDGAVELDQIGPRYPVLADRQRMKPEVTINTQEICPTCNGTGKISSALILEDEIEKNLSYLLNHQHKDLILVVHPIMHAYLTKGGFLGFGSKQWSWRWKYKQKVRIRANTNYHLTEFHFFDKQEDEIKL